MLALFTNRHPRLGEQLDLCSACIYELATPLGRSPMLALVFSEVGNGGWPWRSCARPEIFGRLMDAIMAYGNRQRARHLGSAGIAIAML